MLVQVLTEPRQKTQHDFAENFPFAAVRTGWPGRHATASYHAAGLPALPGGVSSEEHPLWRAFDSEATAAYSN